MSKLKVGTCHDCDGEIEPVLRDEAWVGQHCPACGMRWNFIVIRTVRGAVEAATAHLRSKLSTRLDAQLRALVDERMAGVERRALLELAVYAGMAPQRDLSRGALGEAQLRREAVS